MADEIYAMTESTARELVRAYREHQRALDNHARRFATFGTRRHEAVYVPSKSGDIVQVHHTSGGPSAGDTVQANADGFHKARIARWIDDDMDTTFDDVWLLFVDDYDNAAGDVEAVQDEYYGPARKNGTATSDGETLVVYTCKKAEATATGVPFRNDSGESIPPFAVMRCIDGVVIGSTNYITVGKPSTEFQRFYLVNGSSAVAAGETSTDGHWLFDDAGRAAYDDSDGSPIAGESWGAKPGSWLLHYSRPGFTGLQPATSPDGIDVLEVKQYEANALFGKAYEELAQGATALCRIWFYNGTKWYDTQQDVTVLDFFLNKNETIEVGTKLTPEWYCGQWVVRNAYCAVADTDEDVPSPAVQSPGDVLELVGTESSGLTSSGIPSDIAGFSGLLPGLDD